MRPGRYLINNFKAFDGYTVSAPEEVRVVEVSRTQLFVRVIWDHGKQDQSWESLPELTNAVVEYLDEGQPPAQVPIQLLYPSVTTSIRELQPPVFPHHYIPGQR
jgi:hypothetical protein